MCVRVEGCCGSSFYPPFSSPPVPLHPQETFTNFINKIERDYCFEPSKPNPYHMHVHAADVVQAVGCFLIVPRLAQMLDQVRVVTGGQTGVLVSV